MANSLVEVKQQSIATFLAEDSVKENVKKIVGDKDAQKFISSVVSAVQTNPDLAKCTNKSLLNAALLGYSLNLPQSPQIGMFYMVPFKNKKKVTDEKGKETTVEVTEATFQLSYRGMLQLAMRSGQYQKIHVTDIREGELKSYNPIEDEYEFNPETDMEARLKLKVIGYYAYFVLVNGMRKTLYWSREQMEEHAKKYSMSYRNGWNSSLWKSDFDKMAYKTMLRQLISKYGPMSVEMEKAYVGDQSVIDDNGNPDYVDNVPDEPTAGVNPFAEGGIIDVEESEVVEVGKDAEEVFPNA